MGMLLRAPSSNIGHDCQAERHAHFAPPTAAKTVKRGIPASNPCHRQARTLLRIFSGFSHARKDTCNYNKRSDLVLVSFFSPLFGRGLASCDLLGMIQRWRELDMGVGVCMQDLCAVPVGPHPGSRRIESLIPPLSLSCQREFH